MNMLDHRGKICLILQNFVADPPLVGLKFAYCEDFGSQFTEKRYPTGDGDEGYMLKGNPFDHCDQLFPLWSQTEMIQAWFQLFSRG